MRSQIQPAIRIARSALYGYVLVFLVIVVGIMALSAVALFAGVSSLTIGLGPVPLMSFWNSGAGYGFQSGWGVAGLSCAGAAVGVGLELRRAQTTRAAG
jgi:hypothetical protein